MQFMIRLESDITWCVCLYIFGKVDLNNDWTLEEPLILHNVIILTNSGFNWDQNDYHYNIFLEKCSYQLAKK